jgi:metal-responsive CopG/Arc/MetJ family transcriptional regulator
MPRTIIDIPHKELQAIDDLRQILGIKSRAEIFRRALRDFLLNNGDVKVDGFGLWRETAEPKALRDKLRNLK